MTFGEKVKALREKNKMSQKELAKKMGMTCRAIQRYESGETYPRDRKKYDELAELFGVDVNYLRTENEEFLGEVADRYGHRGQMQASELLEQAKGLLAGGDLSPEDQKAFIYDMQQLFFVASDIAKEKYDPYKNRREGAKK